MAKKVVSPAAPASISGFEALLPILCQFPIKRRKERVETAFRCPYRFASSSPRRAGVLRAKMSLFCTRSLFKSLPSLLSSSRTYATASTLSNLSPAPGSSHKVSRSSL